MDSTHRHVLGSGIGDHQHPAVGADAVTEEITHLLARLEDGVTGHVVDSTMRLRHGDRKELSREQEKKIALGHKPDDHEEGQKMM